MSIDTVENAEIKKRSHIMEELASTCRKPNSHEILQVAVSISYEDDESWFDAYKDINLWHDAW